MANYRRDKDFSGSYLSLDGAIWWVITGMLILTFSILSWSGCYYLFNYPEIPRNFKFLKKIGRIGEITAFSTLNAPATSSASPVDLYELFYSLEESKIKQFNKMLKRGYITNYEKIPVYRYLKGEFRIIEVRELTKKDFISPGILIKARAYVKPDKNSHSTPYPLVIDYIIPTNVEGAQTHFQPGDLMEITKSNHCASIVHVQKEGREEDPTLRCLVIPLAYNHYISPDKKKIPMQAPDTVNVETPFPLR